jgi:hypothetical protein
MLNICKTREQLTVYLDRPILALNLLKAYIEGKCWADLSSALREVYEPKQTNTGYNANGIASQQNRRNQSLSNENVLTYLKRLEFIQ